MAQQTLESSVCQPYLLNHVPDIEDNNSHHEDSLQDNDYDVDNVD